MRYILPFLFASSLLAAESVLKQFGALVMPRHQGTNHLFVNIPSKTWAETEEERLVLNDERFVQAMKELYGQPIHKLQVRGSEITDLGLDVLAQFPTIKKLDISRSQITNEGIKKIVMYCPRLKYLNLWGNTNITDQSLIHLRDLWSLEDLYLFGTSVTWDAANKHRGIMQSMAAQENLTINISSKFPTLYAFSDEELWKRTYQKNVEIGIIDKAEVLKKHGQLAPDKVDYNNKYEEDLANEATDPILKEETP